MSDQPKLGDPGYLELCLETLREIAHEKGGDVALRVGFILGTVMKLEEENKALKAALDDVYI